MSEPTIEVRVTWQREDGKEEIEFYDVSYNDDAELFSTLDFLQSRVLP